MVQPPRPPAEVDADGVDLAALQARVRATGQSPGEVADNRTYYVALGTAAVIGLLVVLLDRIGWSGAGAWLPDIGLLYGLAIGGAASTAVALQVRVWVLGDRTMRWAADGYTLVTILIWLSIQNTSFYQGVDLAASATTGFAVSTEPGPLGIGFAGLVSLFFLWHLTIAVMAIGATRRPLDNRLRLATFWGLTVLTLPVAYWVPDDFWFGPTGLTAAYDIGVWVLVALYLAATAVWVRGSGERPDMARAAVAIGLVFGFFELGLQALTDFGTANVTWIVVLLVLSLSAPGLVEIWALGRALAAKARGEKLLLRMVVAGLNEPSASQELARRTATTALAGAAADAGPGQAWLAELPIERVAAELDFDLALQPIVHLTDGSVAGYEALARFPNHPKPTPDVWLDEAHRRGLGVDVELALIRKGINLLEIVEPHAYVSVNVGVEALLDPRLEALFRESDPSRLVLEVTEHLPIEDYAKVLSIITPLRQLGVRLAVDDAGAGFASLRHVIQLRPDILKLDRSLVDRSDEDPARRAVIAAMTDIAAKSGMDVVGEGVERPEEAAVLRALGAGKAQGYLFGRPEIPRSRAAQAGGATA